MAHGKRQIKGLLLLLPLLLPLLASCHRADPLAPPEIRFGVDACAECGMIVSDERFAAAAVVPGERGPEPLVFDDVGCLLAFEAGREGPVTAHWVRDFTTRAWLDVDGAVFVHSPALASPMAFDVAASASREEARRLQTAYPGDLLDAAGVRARFAAGALGVSPDFGEDAGPADLPAGR